jgi:hypothetical protein
MPSFLHSTHLHEDVSDVEDTQACSVLGIREVQIRLKTPQTSSGDVVSVEVVHDVDEDEQGASERELGGPAS